MAWPYSRPSSFSGTTPCSNIEGDSHSVVSSVSWAHVPPEVVAQAGTIR